MKMEKSSKPEESKSRRKSSKPVRNWRAIGMAVENASPETECIGKQYIYIGKRFGLGNLGWCPVN